MKGVLRKLLGGATAAMIALIACLGLVACSQSQEEVEPSKTIKDPPEIEYTIDEEIITHGVDANNSAFYAANVEKVEGSFLEGKTIYWLGSSVTYGASSGGQAMAEFLAAKTGAICRKDAVSGTTIFDDGSSGNTGSGSYTRRLANSTVFDKSEQIDAFICQISTNDAISSRLSKRGEMTALDVVDIDAFDRKTTLGGVEYIIAYVTETWNCPVYFYSGSYFGNNGSGEARTNGDPSGSNYAKLVDDVLLVVDKWKALGYNVDVIDLFNDKDFNAQVSDQYYKWCTSDAIHPKRAGYLNWWMPYFEQFLVTRLNPEYGY